MIRAVIILLVALAVPTWGGQYGTVIVRRATTTTATTTSSTTSTAAPTTTSSTAAATTTTSGGTTTTSTTLVVLPVQGGSSANCPSTVPGTGGSGHNGFTNWIGSAKTCTTGSNTNGYDVQSIVFYIGAATSGDKVKCSVYTNATPEVEVASGCETGDVTLTTNPNAFQTAAVSGSCHLAASTVYQIACIPNANDTFGDDSGTANQWGWFFQGSYTFPSSWTPSGHYPQWPAYYANVSATP